MNASLNITATLPPELSSLLSRLRRPRVLMKDLGRKAEEALQEHFLSRNQEPPKSGLKRQEWWSKVRDATHLTDYSENSATVTITSKKSGIGSMFALRVHGGIVRPREKKFMAVPLVNEAVGKYPRTMSGLFFLRLKEGGAYLAKEKGRGKNKKLTLYFRLIKQATHKPDPRALPNMDALRAELIADAETLLTAQK